MNNTLEQVTFTEWLFSLSNPEDENDPIIKFKNKYYKDIEWPVGISSLEELTNYINATFKEEIELLQNRLKGELYTAKLAWGDYEEYRKNS